MIGDRAHFAQLDNAIGRARPALVEWRPEWSVLIVSPAVLANERNMFNWPHRAKIPSSCHDASIGPGHAAHVRTGMG